jgi:hypothetical protein
VEVDRFLSSLYDYKLMSVEEFYKHEGKETIEINSLSKVFSILFNLDLYKNHLDLFIFST